MARCRLGRRAGDLPEDQERRAAQRGAAAAHGRGTRRPADRAGVVFLSPRGPYDDRRGAYGGQIKKGRYGALARAGLDRELAPYDLRHTWASWHYAVHRDLLALKVEGGWSSVALVERYAHLLPQGHEAAIGRFLGHQAGTDRAALRASA